jgi:isoleucyl-tRNA synthetase
VLSVRPELTWPSDLYLEGSDQHRGWFQSSLLLGLGTRGRAPYRQVVTHGFLLDTDGQKMSKSLGNAISPQDVIKQSGADILRLWVSMSDYQEETRVSKEILARVAEAYRKIRNTLRYLLSNLYDFNPATDAVERTQMEEVDRYILARYGELARKIVSAYDAYDYSTIFQAVNAFITVDLSAFYADVSKDRLYTLAAGSKERRSAQTAMFVMTDGLTRLLAPILSFSMEELWRYVPGKRDESVHLALFPTVSDIDPMIDRQLIDTWDHLLRIRTSVNASLEPLRKEKTIGTSLEARVSLTASGEDLALLQQYASHLPMLFIVSEVVINQGSAPHEATTPALGVAVGRASGVKCERCWRYVSAVSSNPAQPGICDRCQDALAETVAS